jgi:DNA polymerase-1
VANWQYRDEGKRISKSVISDKSTEDLVEAKNFLNGLLDLRKSEKLTKTYIQGTKNAIAYNEHDKIYVDFRFDGTATGRLSCAAYTAQKAMGVSFHTLPRETINNIRSLFRAPDDWAFITADYAAMELRVLSHIAKEGNMQLAFNQGADLHTYTARLLFNKEKITKQERQIAKTVSFLIVYGGGAFNLSETMGISLSRAKKIIKDYENVYPGIFEYMEFVNKFIKENGYAYTIFGRKRNLPNVRSKDRKVVSQALRQGLNFTIQSAASDILLTSLLGASDRFKEAGMQANFESRPVATVHDSIEVVCPQEEVKDALTILYDEMVNYPKIKDIFNIEFDVPFAIDAEVGKSFGDGEAVEFLDGVPALVL